MSGADQDAHRPTYLFHMTADESVLAGAKPTQKHGSYRIFPLLGGMQESGKHAG